MLATLGYIVVGLALVIGAIFAIASTRPDNFLTARTTRITAPPERLFGLIDDLRQMNTWNPYALRDPSNAIDYGSATKGRGASYAFGGGKSGSGSLEILDSSPPSNVVMRLVMVKPFKADNTVRFTLQPQGPATDVTWAMSGRQPLLAKVMSLFINCDKMVGRDFEQGLANLKAIAERA
jgi:uncharacterized protein YndB with AHSA1/START domain